MPSRRVHKHLDELLLGKKYTWVHKWMDAPWKTLGRKHRRVRHDFPGTPLTIYLMSGGDDKAAAAAALHVMLDEGWFSPDLAELLYRVYGTQEKQTKTTSRRKHRKHPQPPKQTLTPTSPPIPSPHTQPPQPEVEVCYTPFGMPGRRFYLRRKPRRRHKSSETKPILWP